MTGVDVPCPLYAIAGAAIVSVGIVPFPSLS
jgi:hypothetical protein